MLRLNWYKTDASLIVGHTNVFLYVLVLEKS